MSRASQFCEKQELRRSGSTRFDHDTNTILPQDPYLYAFPYIATTRVQLTSVMPFLSHCY